jgi:hypothetical protein
MAETFAILSGLTMLLAGSPYLISILRHVTKPERTSWFIWSALGVIAFVSQVGLGAHWSLVYAGISAVGNLLVFLLSLHYGVGGWRKIDGLSLALAAIGAVVSLAIRDPLYALYGVVVANLAGTVPTIYKTYGLQKSESTIAWFFISTSSFFGTLSVGSWSFKLLLYPASMAVTSYAVLVAQWLGHLLHRPVRAKALAE